MSPTKESEDPIIKLLEKELRESIANFETAHGIIVSYAKLEWLRQETDEGVTHGVNLDARIEIIV